MLKLQAFSNKSVLNSIANIVLIRNSRAQEKHCSIKCKATGSLWALVPDVQLYTYYDNNCYTFNDIVLTA
jgi:hypothetical protein